ncbi:(2Fe-2S)-binding protein [Stakelama tenebrarum]|uniref:(2Fe-2S)-binding protein n=1 Tax=Stakelama tenebrarum TaxID=2711215 RepID=A0A6G6Y6I4_9SPHN|nr:(2Fe-2S)-binding protein [Sphingosinithalassobacter tenebrarum]QIG80193.1 (2Fe-2S)-binding protein [Sphingosinithalassobacter tenebrarum]
MTRFTVNNKPIEYKMDPDTPLLWALRDASNLTGTKYGCGTGECGACMVIVDGAARPACQMSIASLEGTFVTTIEGLAKDRGHPVQQALIAANVPQCGYCIPGVVMSAAVLLQGNRSPSEADIKGAIPNICRCGIYPRLVDAISHAASIARGETQAPGENGEGSPSPGFGNGA